MDGIIRTRHRRVINPLDGLLPSFGANTKPRPGAFSAGILRKDRATGACRYRRIQCRVSALALINAVPICA
jgi:hypothetical protein